MKKIVIQAATIIALTATAVSALGDMDTDGDGLLSYNEMLAAHPDMTEEAFVSIDTNADGAVDADELQVGVEAGLLPAES